MPNIITSRGSGPRILNMEDTDKCSTFFREIFFLINIICHGLIIYLASMIALHIPHTSIQTHVILCTIGGVILLPEAILAMADENVWSFFLSNRAKARVHRMLQIVGTVCVILGTMEMYKIQKHSHYQSAHGMAGIASVILLLILTTLSYPILFLRAFRRIISPRWSKFYHRILGLTSFIVMMHTQCTGYTEKWGNGYFNTNLYIQAFVMDGTVALTILIFISAARSLFKCTTARF